MAVTSRIDGLVVTEHELEVPLDHAHPNGPTIGLFAREVADPEGTDRPYLVFLQGGPGHEAPRPQAIPTRPGWLARALKDYRVILLDQRGTGRSTPFGGGCRPEGGPAAEAEYLTHFRADAIVADAELLRRRLGVRRWSVLGQSFGGFTTLHYLSVAAASLEHVYITGGLSPIGRHCDEVYASTYETMRNKSQRYYRRYPQDRARMERLVEACDGGEVTLPDATVATGGLLRTVGIQLGMDGGAELVHFLLERDHRSPAFASDLSALLPFCGRNPLYAIIHESSYSDGCVTGWSASRTMPDDFASDPTLFTGEHVYPWHFEVCRDLAPYRETAEILAKHQWPKLYDAEALRSTDVRGAAAVYGDDAFVTRRFSEETAELMPGLSVWLTNEYEHNGLRTSGDRVLDRLIAMAHV